MRIVLMTNRADEDSTVLQFDSDAVPRVGDLIDAGDVAWTVLEVRFMYHPDRRGAVGKCGGVWCHVQ